MSQAQTADGRYISWREHIIDDPQVVGEPDLAGSDGLDMSDLDGDGFEDIVAVHEADIVYDGRPVGFVRIAWGTGDPDKWLLTTLSSGPEAAAAEDVSIADANGDGHPDIIVDTELAHLVYFQNPGRNARSARKLLQQARATRTAAQMAGKSFSGRTFQFSFSRKTHSMARSGGNQFWARFSYP